VDPHEDAIAFSAKEKNDPRRDSKNSATTNVWGAALARRRSNPGLDAILWEGTGLPVLFGKGIEAVNERKVFK